MRSLKKLLVDKEYEKLYASSEQQRKVWDSGDEYWEIAVADSVLCCVVLYCCGCVVVCVCATAAYAPFLTAQVLQAEQNELREKLIAVLENPNYKTSGTSSVSNRERASSLADDILTAVYRLVREDVAELKTVSDTEVSRKRSLSEAEDGKESAEEVQKRQRVDSKEMLLTATPTASGEKSQGRGVRDGVGSGPMMGGVGGAGGMGMDMRGSPYGRMGAPGPGGMVWGGYGGFGYGMGWEGRPSAAAPDYASWYMAMMRRGEAPAGMGYGPTDPVLADARSAGPRSRSQEPEDPRGAPRAAGSDYAAAPSGGRGGPYPYPYPVNSSSVPPPPYPYPPHPYGYPGMRARPPPPNMHYSMPSYDARLPYSGQHPSLYPMPSGRSHLAAPDTGYTNGYQGMESITSELSTPRISPSASTKRGSP